MKAILTSILTLNIIIAHAQTPQFAVVRPNGTTYICPTWDSAYNKSQNGDNIYSPGGTFNVTEPLDKRLYIYGAGFNIDSNGITGITKLNNVTILSGANNGAIEGINFNRTFCGPDGSITFGSTTNAAPLSN